MTRAERFKMCGIFPIKFRAAGKLTSQMITVQQAGLSPHKQSAMHFLIWKNIFKSVVSYSICNLSCSTGCLSMICFFLVAGFWSLPQTLTRNIVLPRHKIVDLGWLYLCSSNEILPCQIPLFSTEIVMQVLIKAFPDCSSLFCTGTNRGAEQRV